jgi:hypothetical protein
VLQVNAVNLKLGVISVGAAFQPRLNDWCVVLALNGGFGNLLK